MLGKALTFAAAIAVAVLGFLKILSGAKQAGRDEVNYLAGKQREENSAKVDEVMDAPVDLDSARDRWVRPDSDDGRGL